METLGVFSSSARQFLSSLGRRISTGSGEARETCFFFQRISVLLQRFNAVLLTPRLHAGVRLRGLRIVPFFLKPLGNIIPPEGIIINNNNNKEVNYAGLDGLSMFAPIAFENLGVPSASTRQLLSDLGRRLTVISGESRETSYLFQRCSVLVQRFNAVLWHDS